MIDLFNYPGDALAKLADNDRLRNVEDLELCSAGKSPASVRAFFDGPAAASLVRLQCGALDSVELAALAGTRTASRLRYLRLYFESADPVTDPLFTAERFPRLRWLDLSGSVVASGERLGEDTVQRLITGPADTPLRRLDLSWCRLTDVGAEQLAAWPGLAKLRWLDLDSNLIRNAGFLALARSPHTSNLECLKVDGFWLRDLPKVKAELDARFGKVIDYG